MSTAITPITWLVYALAAACEIGGCFCVWKVHRLGQSPWWLAPAAGLLAAFAWLLARVETPTAGRAYAAYAGVYLLGALAWTWLIERQAPDRWDLLGGVLALAGTAIMLFGARGIGAGTE